MLGAIQTGGGGGGGAGGPLFCAAQRCRMRCSSLPMGGRAPTGGRRTERVPARPTAQASSSPRCSPVHPGRPAQRATACKGHTPVDVGRDSDRHRQLEGDHRLAASHGQQKVGAGAEQQLLQPRRLRVGVVLCVCARAPKGAGGNGGLGLRRVSVVLPAAARMRASPLPPAGRCL